MKSAPSSTGARPAPRDVLRVVLVYAVFAGLWILVSDNLVVWRFGSTDHVLAVSLLKGWLFVTVTSVLLYVLIRRLLDQALVASRRELAAQEEAARAQHLLFTISDNSSDAIFAKDLEGRYLLFNRETARIIGKPAEYVLGRDDAALFSPQQVVMIRANDLRVVAEQRINTYEEALSTVDGERIYQATKGPLRDAEGRIVGLFGIARDITERKQVERELRRNMEELARFNRAAVDRELDMIRLKLRVNELSRQLGQTPPHALDFVDATLAGELNSAAGTVGGNS
ncbi:PAS domain-containing protein [Sulfuritalea sp.]|uniref:PAS domain-containing protein n=1 Tax=Sulfuritalea sp. TaxID=2480090 RepID=UPI00286D7D14|nr:PAS domain-containing protein [Sulfuritalea sp.]